MRSITRQELGHDAETVNIRCHAGENDYPSLTVREPRSCLRETPSNQGMRNGIHATTARLTANEFDGNTLPECRTKAQMFDARCEDATGSH